MRPFLVFLVSLLGHVGLAAAGFLYFPDTMRQFTTSQVVPLELITEFQEITNLREEEVEEEPVIEEVPPEPEDLPPPPDPEPEVQLEADPDIAPTEQVEEQTETEAAPATDAPVERDEPATPPRSREDTLSSLLNDLANTVDEERAASSSQNDRAARAAYEALGVTFADSIRSQAQRCYRSSADAPNPEQLIVLVRVRLNRDGSLDGEPDVLNRNTIDNSGNQFWRVARNRSVAAIIECAPYRLPAEHFSVWRRIDVTFRSDN